VIAGRIVRDGGATVVPREFKDEAEVEGLRNAGFHVEVDAALMAPPEEGDPPPSPPPPPAPGPTKPPKPPRPTANKAPAKKAKK